jgi:hypothetical protein
MMHHISGQNGADDGRSASARVIAADVAVRKDVAFRLAHNLESCQRVVVLQH